MKVFKYFDDNYICYGKFSARHAYNIIEVGALQIRFSTGFEAKQVFDALKEKTENLSEEDTVVLYEGDNVVVALPISAMLIYHTIYLSNGRKIYLGEKAKDVFSQFKNYLRSLSVKDVLSLVAYNMSDIISKVEEIQGEVDRLEDNTNKKVEAMEKEIKELRMEITSLVSQLNQLHSTLEQLENKDISLNEMISEIKKSLQETIKQQQQQQEHEQQKQQEQGQEQEQEQVQQEQKQQEQQKQ